MLALTLLESRGCLVSVLSRTVTKVLAILLTDFVLVKNILGALDLPASQKCYRNV